MVLDPHDQVDVGAFAGEAGASVPTADDVFEPGREQRRPRPPLPIGIDQAHVGTWFPWRPPNEQGQGRAHHRREIALRNPTHSDKGAGNPATRVRAAQPVDDRRGRMQVAKDIVAAITGEDGIEAVRLNLRAISALDLLHELPADRTRQVRRSRLRQIDLLRSEEHTSELQSLMRISYAVFCLKKKK